MTKKATLIGIARSPILQAGVVAVVAYIAGVVVNLVTANPDGTSSFWILLCGGLIACVLLSLAAAALDAAGRTQRERLEREHAAHRSGYQTLNREISGYIALARRFQPADPSMADTIVGLMRNACRDLYDTLETEYGYKVSISEHIEFEVTFMTRSLADGQITIAAWANRNARAPNSLAGRAANPDLYSGTETYLLYQDPNRSARFVSSTTNSYKELYPGQLKRIKSSVIWPVLDDGFALQGTLVVHCDREGFFSDRSQKFWGEMLEPYTKRLALARVLIDRAHHTGMNVGF